MGTLTEAQLRELLPHVWSAAEYPAILGVRASLKLWRAAGFVSEDGRPHPAEPIRLWRGADARRWWGMSWSESVESARSFAKFAARRSLGRSVSASTGTLSHAQIDVLLEKKTTGAVFEALVPPQAILAFTGRGGPEGEAEVVVNPYCLRGRWAPCLVETVEALD